MAELLDKLIQNGRISFVPRSNKTRSFWTKYNSKIAGSRNAQKETVTIVPATEEEMAEYYKQAAPAPVAKVVPATQNSEIEELRMLLADQQRLIHNLLLKGTSGEQEPDGQKEKGKPGPKPKNQDNGENTKT